MVTDLPVVILGYPGKNLFTDDILAGFVKVPAIGIIDKDMRSIRTEPYNQLCRFLDNIPVYTLAGQECLFCLLPFADVPHDCLNQLLSPEYDPGKDNVGKERSAILACELPFEGLWCAIPGSRNF